MNKVYVAPQNSKIEITSADGNHKIVGYTAKLSIDYTDAYEEMLLPGNKVYMALRDHPVITLTAQLQSNEYDEFYRILVSDDPCKHYSIAKPSRKDAVQRLREIFA